MERARYSRAMRPRSDRRSLQFGLSAALLALVVICDGTVTRGEVPPNQPDLVQVEEYPVYDLVIQSKFLTSDTTLVMINRLTVTQLGPEEELDPLRFFKDNEFFDGRLQPALVTDFLMKLRRPSRLEPKFSFGVRYRLVSGHEDDGSEVSLAPLPATFRQSDYDASSIKLEFSRVSFSPREDLALVYVGNYRQDGSGAGFLVLLRRRDRAWEILDTEVIWTAHV